MSLAVAIFALLYLNISVANINSPNYAYPSHQGKLAIDAELLGKCFAEEARNFPQNRNFIIDKKVESCAYNQDDFISYLAAFPDRKCDLSSGQKSKLREWILQQKITL